VTANAWDDVVVGAGSTGALLAARLSDDRSRRVLLVEAGPDPAAGPDGGARLRDAGIPKLSGYSWDWDAEVCANGGRRTPYLLGRVVGGSAAINGSIALRAFPSDFQAWAAAAAGWSWADVAPWFTRLENDLDMRSAEHGGLGSIPISRPDGHRLGVLASAFVAACRAHGLRDVDDLNAAPVPGVGLVPLSSIAGRRMSTATAVLEPVRTRGNLELWTGTHAVRVQVRKGRAYGVELLRNRRPETVLADRVTLTAGAIGTAALLLRSGIGPARELAPLGVGLVTDLPGVGRNLADHPAVALWTLPVHPPLDPDQPWHQVAARVSTASTGNADPDVTVFLLDNVRGRDMPGFGSLLGPGTAAAVSAMLATPRSRGSVTLRDADPLSAPRIALHLAREEADVQRLMAATRAAWSLVRSPCLSSRLGRVLVWTDRIVSDDELLRDAVRRFVSSTWHPVGTARMGEAGDPAAVVDARCTVHGVERLRVADASVMPTIPSAPPNLTCIMIAERVAAWMA
jgi:choline dehydrogenase